MHSFSDVFKTSEKKVTKKRKEPRIFTIKIDNREELNAERPEILNLLYKLSEVLKIQINIDIQQLAIGDYVIEDKIIIERKSVPDAIKSIREGGHLKSQLQRLNLAKQTDPSLDIRFVIIGDLDQDIKNYVNWNKSKIAPELLENEYLKARKSLISVITEFQEFGISSTFMPTNTDFTYYMLKSIHYKFIKKAIFEVPPPVFSKIVNDLDATEKTTIGMYKSIPGIDDIRARKLIQAYKNISELSNATIDELQSVLAPVSSSSSPSVRAKNRVLATNVYNALRGLMIKEQEDTSLE